MVCGNIQCFKVVVVSLDFRSFNNFISHSDEDSLNLFLSNLIRMTMSYRILLGRKSNVNDLTFHLCFPDHSLKLNRGFLEYSFNLGTCIIHKLSYLGPVLRAHVLHTLEYLSKLSFFTENINSCLIESLKFVCTVNSSQGIILNLLQLILHVFVLSSLCLLNNTFITGLKYLFRFAPISSKYILKYSQNSNTTMVERLP